MDVPKRLAMPPYDGNGRGLSPDGLFSGKCLYHIPESRPRLSRLANDANDGCAPCVLLARLWIYAVRQERRTDGTREFVRCTKFPGELLRDQ